MHTNNRGQSRSMRRTTKNKPLEEKPARGTISLVFDYALWNEVKHQAIDEGRSPGYLMEDAVRAYLERQR